TATDNNVANVTIRSNYSSTKYLLSNNTGSNWYLSTTLAALGCSTGKDQSYCTLTATITDRALNTNATTYVVIADDVTPSITSLKSNDTNNVSRSNTPLNITVTVVDSNIRNVTLRSNYTSTKYLMSKGAGSIWQLSTTLAGLGCLTGGDRIYCTLTAQVLDKADNTNLTSYQIIVDDQNPYISMLKSNDTDNVSRSNVVLNFTVTMTDLNIENVTLKSNYTSSKYLMSPGGGSTWKLSTTLAALGCPTGKPKSYCKLNATAIDKAHNRNSTSYVIIVDDVRPFISSLVSNDTDAITRSSSVLNFTVTSSDSHLVNVTLRSNYTASISLMQNSTLTSWHLATNASSLGCPSGGANTPCRIIGNATDVVRYYNSTTYLLFIDDVDPVIANFTINDTDNVSRSSARINFSVHASDVNIANVTVKSNYSSAQYLMTLGSGNKWHYVTNLSSLGCPSGGAKTYCRATVRVTDKVNHKRTLNYTIIVDDTTPSISLLRSNDTDNVSRSNVMLNFTVTASDSNLANVTLKSNYSSTKHLMRNNSASSWYVNLTLAALGCPTGKAKSFCTFTSTITDLAGNRNSMTYVMIADDVTPSIAGLDSDDSNDIAKSVTLLRFTVTATDKNVANVTLESNYTGVKNIMTNTSAGSWNISTTLGALGCNAGGPESYCTLTSRILDKAGNRNSTTYAIIVDDVLPVLTNFRSNDSDNYSRSDRILNFSAYVADLHMSNVTLKSNYSSSKYLFSLGSGNIWSLPKTLASLGCPTGYDAKACTVIVNATDQAGNTLRRSFNITVDDVSPSIAGFQVNDSDKISRSDSKLNFTINATDAHLINVSLYSNYSSAKSLMTHGTGNVWYLTTTLATLGCSSGKGSSPCTIYVVAADIVNNRNTTSLNLTVDDVKPFVTNFRHNDSDNISRS
ncbi:hypothetical protein COY95_00450, partial [Candidatus Woesearchaeota archaeon CG_4_10_14_0_8_um_filter_47_5]